MRMRFLLYYQLARLQVVVRSVILSRFAHLFTCEVLHNTLALAPNALVVQRNQPAQPMSASDDTFLRIKLLETSCSQGAGVPVAPFVAVADASTRHLEESKTFLVEQFLQAQMPRDGIRRNWHNSTQVTGSGLCRAADVRVYNPNLLLTLVSIGAAHAPLVDKVHVQTQHPGAHSDVLRAAHLRQLDRAATLQPQVHICSNSKGA